MGVDAVEIDVQRTVDEHLVVLHDRPYAGELTVDDIRNQPVPSLAEVLETVNGRAALMIELKQPGIAGDVLYAVRQSGFRGMLFYASFLHSELLKVRELEPQAATIALLEGVPVSRTAFATDAKATHAGLAIDSLYEPFVRELHEAGFRVFTYTADKPEQIAYAKACHVDGIISNYPDRL